MSQNNPSDAQSAGTRSSSPFQIAPERVTVLVGATAAALPAFMLWVSAPDDVCRFDSISHYYFSRFGGDWFVGSLCFIGLLMMFLFIIRPGQPGFEGFRPRDRWIMRLAGLSAFLIAFFPTAGTGCQDLSSDLVRVFVNLPPDARAIFENHADGVVDLAALGAQGSTLAFNSFAFGPWAAWVNPALHGAGAVFMFSALGYFSLFVFTRQQSDSAVKPSLAVEAVPNTAMGAFRAFNLRKQIRNLIYVAAGIVIFGCILTIIASTLYCTWTDGAFCEAWQANDATFWFEAIALWAFAASWLVKGRAFGLLKDRPRGGTHTAQQPPHSTHSETQSLPQTES